MAGRLFSELLCHLNRCSPFYGWDFRGQENADWGLTPKVARLPSMIERVEIWERLYEQQQTCLGIETTESTLANGLNEYVNYLRLALEKVELPIRELERTLLNNWKAKAVQFLTTSPRNDIEWLAVAQHHGLGTRLLDWTQSPLVAAYFALESDVECDAAIYAFNTSFGVAAPTDDVLEKFDSHESQPAIILKIRPPSIADRIVRQKGLFTTHRQFWVDVKRLVKTGAASGVLRMIRIPEAARQSIFRQIMSLGIDRSVLFPDLDGLAHHINYMASSIGFLRGGFDDDWDSSMLRGWLDESNERRNQLPQSVRDLLNQKRSPDDKV